VNKNKKTLALLSIGITIVTVIILFLIRGNNSKNEVAKFALNNNMLTGNQYGQISLVNINLKGVLSSVNLEEEARKEYVPTLSTKNTSFFDQQESLTINNQPTGTTEVTNIDIGAKPLDEKTSEKVENTKDVVKKAETGNPNTSTKAENNSITSRDVEIKGESFGYDIVAIKIVKDEYWLKIQKQLIPDVPEWILLKMGKEINGKQQLHPIYDGNVLLFLADKGYFNQEAEVPVENVVEEEPVVVEPIIEKNPIIEPKIEEIKEIGETKKSITTKDYIYSFSDEGYYVYDNIESRLYEIKILDNVLSVTLVCDMKNVIIKEYALKNNVFYFTTSENIDIYAFDGNNSVKLGINSNIETWTVDDDFVYYAAIEAIYRVNMKNKEQIYLYLGAETTDINVSNEYIYVANKFGSTISKSVIHKLGKDFASYGWAEINYAKDTDIVYEKNNEFLLKQDMQGQIDKLVYIGNEFEMKYEVGLEKSYENIKVYDDKYIYGMNNEVLYLYDIQGALVNSVGLQANEVFILD